MNMGRSAASADQHASMRCLNTRGVVSWNSSRSSLTPLRAMMRLVSTDSQARAPWNISHKITPNENTSVLKLISPSSSNSGGMYGTVLCRADLMKAVAMLSVSMATAMDKSATLHCSLLPPSWCRSTLLPDRLPCTTPWLWKCTRQSATCTAASSTARMSTDHGAVRCRKHPDCMLRDSLPRLHSSIAIQVSPSTSSKACSSTSPGCFSLACSCCSYAGLRGGSWSSSALSLLRPCRTTRTASSVPSSRTPRNTRLVGDSPMRERNSMPFEQMTGDGPAGVPGASRVTNSRPDTALSPGSAWAGLPAQGVSE
mmetsp:Transcript_46164/g.117870  ORF Transcript_46164/g.117870 Transcript_46164/m.117870 type:complete len:312 (-) Transcript_46164:963-1898(-)